MTTEKKIIEALSTREGELSILDELYEAALVAMKDAEQIAALNDWHNIIRNAIQAEYDRAVKEALKGGNMQ